MRHLREEIEIVADREYVYNEDRPWAVFDPDTHSEFFPDVSRSLDSVPSPNGRYRAAYARRESTTIDGEQEPAGICLVDSHNIVTTVVTDPVEMAIPANDGTIVAIGRNGTKVAVYDDAGKQLLTEAFESNVGPIAISPDGRYIAVATAFPDNAVHLYDVVEDQYLGRQENATTTVIMSLEFSTGNDGYVVETYDIHPESDLAAKVDPQRTEVMDRIPIGPLSNDMEVDGAGIVVEADTWHHVPPAELDAVTGDLRIPGVTLESSCGATIKPLNADLIYRNAQAARESEYEICGDCEPAVTSYPDKKVERTTHGR